MWMMELMIQLFIRFNDLSVYCALGIFVGIKKIKNLFIQIYILWEERDN